MADDDTSSVRQLIQSKMEYLKTSRPTAVNLFNAMAELEQVMDQDDRNTQQQQQQQERQTKQQLIQAVISHAEYMLQRDVADNKAIGSYGAKTILSHTTNDKQNIRLITICNTGSLATANYGTALGVARALHSIGRLESIHCLETRPYNQGSRLTAFEILEEQMPNGTLICDSAAAALMRVKGVDAVVVGADRVCSNGDTANKIGTYMLALVAKEHNVPFYVAAPFTTLDTNLENGDCIEIEERPGEEIIETSKAPKNIRTWNPAFDVTPAKYITGIITEKGVIVKSDGKDAFDVASFIQSHKR
jgi:S-methyl-5-thioribose-1-phosphate isomerase